AGQLGQPHRRGDQGHRRGAGQKHQPRIRCAQPDAKRDRSGAMTQHTSTGNAKEDTADSTADNPGACAKHVSAFQVFEGCKTDDTLTSFLASLKGVPGRFSWISLASLKAVWTALLLLAPGAHALTDTYR